MARRAELQALLVGALGSQNVYFQPPTNVQMQYPCIVYQRDSARTEFAGNKPYNYTQRYQVTLIAREPDSDILARIAELPMCSYNRFFVSDNLNHDVFELYF